MFSGAIIKLTNFCNLNCSYCYMFNLNDDTFKHSLPKMHIQTAKKLLLEVFEYCSGSKIKHFALVLHGGEPMLWGYENFAIFFDYYNELKHQYHDININFSLQTNGYLIDYAILDLFKKNRTTIGISLDGPEKFHDKYRPNHSGLGTYKKIVNNVDIILDKGYADILGGFLTVVNTEIDVSDYFEWILSLPVKSVDILLPLHYNYVNTPWDYYNLTEQSYKETPLIGKWLSDLFLIWYKYDDPNISIRRFKETIRYLLGGKHHGDQIVNDKLSLLVIDSDGSIQHHDYFRGLINGVIKTNYNILNNKIINIQNDLIFKKLFILKDYLPASCLNCDLKEICGGGFLSGRLKNNLNDITLYKSVLCYDEYQYYSTVSQTVSEELKVC